MCLRLTKSPNKKEERQVRFFMDDQLYLFCAKQYLTKAKRKSMDSRLISTC